MLLEVFMHHFLIITMEETEPCIIRSQPAESITCRSVLIVPTLRYLAVHRRHGTLLGDMNEHRLLPFDMDVNKPSIRRTVQNHVHLKG